MCPPSCIAPLLLASATAAEGGQLLGQAPGAGALAGRPLLRPPAGPAPIAAAAPDAALPPLAAPSPGRDHRGAAPPPAAAPAWIACGADDSPRDPCRRCLLLLLLAPVAPLLCRPERWCRCSRWLAVARRISSRSSSQVSGEEASAARCWGETYSPKGSSEFIPSSCGITGGARQGRRSFWQLALQPAGAGCRPPLWLAGSQPDGHQRRTSSCRALKHRGHSRLRCAHCMMHCTQWRIGRNARKF
jgi:hypothetical protein